MSVVAAEQKPELGSVARQGAIATVVAVVVNVVLYFLGSAIGAFPPEALTPLGGPVVVGPVAIMSLLGGVVGTIGYFVLTRFLSRAKANLWFAILVLLVLVGMFFSHSASKMCQQCRSLFWKLCISSWGPLCSISCPKPKAGRSPNFPQTPRTSGASGISAYGCISAPVLLRGCKRFSPADRAAWNSAPVSSPGRGRGGSG